MQYAKGDDIMKACDALDELDGTPMEKLAAYTQIRFGGCIADYDDFVEYYSGIEAPFEVGE